MNPTDATVHTERLVLKDFDENNIEDIYEIFGDEETMKYYDIGPFTHIEEARDFISRIQKRSKDGAGIRWGLFLDEKLIGTCGFNGYKPKGRSVIGYDINRSNRSRCYIRIPCTGNPPNRSLRNTWKYCIGKGPRKMRLREGRRFEAGCIFQKSIPRPNSLLKNQSSPTKRISQRGQARVVRAWRWIKE